jgi:hypothetical protein
MTESRKVEAATVFSKGAAQTSRSITCSGPLLKESCGISLSGIGKEEPLGGARGGAETNTRIRREQAISIELQNILIEREVMFSRMEKILESSRYRHNEVFRIWELDQLRRVFLNELNEQLQGRLHQPLTMTTGLLEQLPVIRGDSARLSRLTSGYTINSRVLLSQQEHLLAPALQSQLLLCPHIGLHSGDTAQQALVTRIHMSNQRLPSATRLSPSVVTAYMNPTNTAIGNLGANNLLAGGIGDGDHQLMA